MIHVCYSPRLFDVYAHEDSIAVVIDVLRASSAICTAIHHGVGKIIPVETVDEAKEYQRKGFIVGAERHGEIVDGFNLGNSPFSYMDEKLRGKGIVLTTTNGTRAVKTAGKIKHVIIASFLNLEAVSKWLAQQKREIVLLCAGWKERYNLEDALLSGAITSRVTELWDADAKKAGIEGAIELSDSALAATYLWQLAKNDLYGFLENSSHRKRLKRLNLEKDIRYCLTVNCFDTIPVVVADGEIVKMNA